MQRKIRIERPIFVIGSGRSGTTLLQNLLCGHPDLAWFSNLSERWPRYPQVAVFSRLCSAEALQRLTPARLPRPSEGHAIWNFCKPVPITASDPPLTEHDVEPQNRSRARAVISTHMRYQGKPRFLNKNTRNTRRIRFLNEIFPDALFIHVIRDPRAVVASLLKVSFWPRLRVWSCDSITPREWAAQGRDPALLAAKLWSANVQRATDDKATLTKDRYLEIHYESLVTNPREVLSEVFAFSSLSWPKNFDSYLGAFALQNMNYKYAQQLNENQLAAIVPLVARQAERFGYDMSFSESS